MKAKPLTLKDKVSRLFPASSSPVRSLQSTTGLSQMVKDYLGAYFKTHGEVLPAAGLYERVLKEIERPLILETLKAVQGNQLKAAAILGIHRNTLRKKIQDLSIDLEREIS